jgi:hypothetical protein
VVFKYNTGMVKTKVKRTRVQIIAIFIALFILLALFSFKNYSAPPTFINNSPDVIIADLGSYLNKTGEKFKQDHISQWWISDDGWNIENQNSKNIVMNIYPCDVKTYFTQCKALTKLENERSYTPYGYVLKYAKLPKAIELNKKVSNVFLANGFTLNKSNSSKSVDDIEFYDYILAFQNEDTRCTVITSPDLSITREEEMTINYEITCSDNFKKNYDQQLSYLKALVEYNDKYREAVVNPHPYSKEGNFENISVHFRRSGESAIMKKTGDKYKVLFLTQQQPSIEQCKILRENGAPPRYLKTCNY